MRYQLTSMPDEKSSVTRRGVMIGLATVAMATAAPTAVEAGADELAFMIDGYRELHAFRKSLTDRIISLEADEPSVIVTRAEIKPSIGAIPGNEFFSIHQADKFFANAHEGWWMNEVAKKRYAESWEFTKALFMERRALHDRWSAETGYSLLVAEEEALFDREAELLDSIVSRPCANFGEAQLLADFVTSDISQTPFYDQHARAALRSIAGRSL